MNQIMKCFQFVIVYFMSSFGILGGSLLLLNCGGNTTTTCAEDSQCPHGQICLDAKCSEAQCSAEKACISGKICENWRCVACKEDIACGQGKICKEGACADGCREDKVCPTGQICKNEVCIDGCRDDSACTDKHICEAELCIPPYCSSEKPCVDGQICSNGRCSECKDDSECVVGHICIAKVCRLGCRDDKGCPKNQKCHLEEYKCVECLQMSDCPQGKICEQWSCRACASDAECGAGKLCEQGQCIEGQCRKSEECKDGLICLQNQCVSCSVDGDCGIGKICESAKCRAGCRKNDDCQSEQICDPQSFLCTGCLQNEDCQAGLVCQNKACVACPDDASCGMGKLCFNGVCIMGNCRSNADCTVGQICKNNLCSACADDKECATNQLCLNGVCITGNCRSNADCTVGQICKENQCRNCLQDSECDTGQLCLNDTCQTGDCRQDSDCASLVCKANQCVAPACDDGVKNGDETDKDCGGSCPACGFQKACKVNSDCNAGLFCANSICVGGKNCRDILTIAPGSSSGIYKLDPCDTGQLADYWCDMTTKGGGWTVAGWQAANAKTNMGIADRGTIGGDAWSKNLKCITYSEIMIFNKTHNEAFSQAYSPVAWNHTSTNMAIGPAGKAFKQGTYGPSNSQIMMGCVDYSYGGGLYPEYACDNDSGRGQKGHIADYAGEFCPGGRLDISQKHWTWTDGTNCKYLGQMYTWGFAIR